MTGVAVQVGTAWLRVAAEGRLVAALPATGAPLPTVLAALFDAPVDELVLVHRAAERPAVAALAPTVRTVPSAVAALRQHAADAGTAVANAVVVDVGHAGTEVALVRGGRVVAVRNVPVGGARLDAVTARMLARAGAAVGPVQARRVREALSLLPTVCTGTPPVPVGAGDLRVALSGPLAAVVDLAARAARTGAGSGRPPPVLLVGGVARTPLLTELLDAAGVDDVRVVERPDTAAVTGALRVPGPPTVRPEPATRLVAAVPPTPTWLPPVLPARHHRTRVALSALGAAVGVAGLVAAGAALPRPAPPPPAFPAPPAPASASASPGELVQYGYAVRLPPGWAHTGGLPERRRSLLTPLAAPDGADLISVERTPLGYDADAEPQRARAELRARFAAAVARGAPLSAFDDDARYAGRPVVSYAEAGVGTGGDVDWYVVLDADAQLSVGCRHVPAKAAAVEAACRVVLGSLRRTA